MKRFFLALLALVTVATGSVAVGDSAPVSAASNCRIYAGYTGSTGSYARITDGTFPCYLIIRTKTKCTGPAGTTWIYGPWRGVNGTSSKAYCSSTGGAYPTRISRSYQTS